MSEDNQCLKNFRFHSELTRMNGGERDWECTSYRIPLSPVLADTLYSIAYLKIAGDDPIQNDRRRFCVETFLASKEATIEMLERALKFMRGIDEYGPEAAIRNEIRAMIEAEEKEVER